MNKRQAVVAMSERTCMPELVLGIVDELSRSEWTVVVVSSHSLPAGWEHRLRQGGVAVLDGRVTAVENVAASAHVHAAILGDWQTAERDLTRLQQVSPGTRALVLAAPPQFLGDARRRLASATFLVSPVFNEEHGSALIRELEVYAAADGVLTVGQPEADGLNLLLGGSTTAHAIGALMQVPTSVVPFTERSAAVYSSADGTTDEAVVEFLCREVAPRLDSRTIDRHPIYIVGLDAVGPPKMPTNSHGVRLVPHVPSLKPYAERARAWLLPLEVPASDRQLLEPLLAGTPVVATPAAIYGTPWRPGVDVLVGDGPDEFAGLATRILTDGDLWKRVSLRGRRRAMDLVRRDDGPSRLLAAVEAALATPRRESGTPPHQSIAPPVGGRTAAPAHRQMHNELAVARTTGHHNPTHALDDAPTHAAVATDAAADDSRSPHTAVYSSTLATARGDRGREYVPLDGATAPKEPPVKVLAFYLPQFHNIPENDLWWGRGFTEWTNVSKAVPQFEGHYQPHLPGELGFYDLRVAEVQRRQVELARQYGVHGFCFYYYWFAGRRLLERPLDQFMSDTAVDYPFCVCWANENWTRRWDGRDSDVLIGQEHTAASDLAFIRDLEPTLRHRNYIRIGGRPMLVIYRPRLLPSPVATARRWREYAAGAGLGDLYLVAAEVFDHIDPAEIGFDAAVEFPPNTPGERRDLTSDVALLNPEYAGTVYDYADLRRLTMKRARPRYPLFRTVCPAWDNEARLPGRGATYAFSSPSEYQRWLNEACRDTYWEADPDRRFVFVNAWNEWGEGAHLEPDRRFGYAYLAATRAVMQSLADDIGPEAAAGAALERSEEWTILFVSHDAARGGAQSVLLDVIAWLRRHTRIRMKIVCLRGGEWLSRFQELAETLVLSEDVLPVSAGRRLADRLVAFCDRPDLIYANSVASGSVFGALQQLGAPILTHVHELEMSIQRYARDWINDVLTTSHHFIACSDPVAENLTLRYKLGEDRVSVVHPAIMSAQATLLPTGADRAALRRHLGLSEETRIVFGCGIGMAHRKGVDLFFEVALRVRAAGNDASFYWIGDLEGEGEENKCWQPGTPGQAGVTFLGSKDDPRLYLQAGDVFLLPSREDPFPLVVLEAADCRLPIVCFDGAGGIPTFVGDDAGRVVPLEDTAAMAGAVIELLADDELRYILGQRARAKFKERFTVDVTIPKVLAVSRAVARRKPAVSVIVPNYNHARFLTERLESIFSQTYQDFEVILLDDASTDESAGILERYRDRAGVTIVRNERNSGSAFRQWLRGIDLAQADLLWLAESDDVNHPDFLATLVPLFDHHEVKLAYCASDVIDESSAVVGDYRSTPYLASLSTTKWQQDYRVSAEKEINDGLGVKNTILSASAVLFRRFDLGPDVRAVLEGLALAGDWYFAIQAIAGGDVHYVAQTLSGHRRHSESVIGKLLKHDRVGAFFHEFYAVQRVIFDLYCLREGFEAKWESYLREQWAAFYPDRPFEDLAQYYPFEDARRHIASVRGVVTKR